MASLCYSPSDLVSLLGGSSSSSSATSLMQLQHISQIQNMLLTILTSFSQLTLSSQCNSGFLCFVPVRNETFFLEARRYWPNLVDRVYKKNDVVYSFMAYLEAWWFTDRTGSIKHVMKIIPAFVLWEIWKCRNKVIYDEEKVDTNQAIRCIKHNLSMALTKLTLRRVNSQDDCLLRHNYLRGFDLAPCRRTLFINWDRPPDNAIKLNTDGSSLGNPGPAGGGYVIRNSSGALIYAACEPYSNCTSLVAEARALLSGIWYCLNHFECHIDIETDSRILYTILAGHQVSPWAIDSEIRDLREALRNENLHLHHIYREANRASDCLANIASSTQETRSYSSQHDAPNALRLILHDDRLALPHLRLV